MSSEVHHTAAADGVQGVLDRDIIVDHEDLDPDALLLGHFLAATMSSSLTPVETHGREER